MRKDVEAAAAGFGDPDLADEIMSLIQSYCETKDAVPCPLELRDTLLTVAALAHLEAARMECRAIDRPADDFALAAYDTYRKATGMLAASVFCAHAPVRVRN